MNNVKRLFLNPELRFNDRRFAMYFALMVVQSVSFQFGCTSELLKCDFPKFLNFKIGKHFELLLPLFLDQLKNCLNDQYLIDLDSDVISIIFIDKNFPQILK